MPGIGEVLVPILITEENGCQTIISFTAPLTPRYSAEPILRDPANISTTSIHLIDELLIRKNLPRTTSDLLLKFGVN